MTDAPGGRSMSEQPSPLDSVEAFRAALDLAVWGGEIGTVMERSRAQRIEAFIVEAVNAQGSALAEIARLQNEKAALKTRLHADYSALWEKEEAESIAAILRAEAAEAEIARLQQELADLTERHANLKANEARVREHYLAENARLEAALLRLRAGRQQEDETTNDEKVARVDVDQPQRIEPAGSTAFSNQLRDGDSPELTLVDTRRLHALFNVGIIRTGRYPGACDGPDCTVCEYVMREWHGEN